MYEFVKYRVQDVMTSSPVTTKPNVTLRELEKVFANHDFNGIPVVDGQGHLAGIVTKFDMLKAFIFSPESLIPHYNEIMDQPAWAVMTSDPVSVEPELPLTRLLELLVEMKTKSLPVVEGERLVGIVSREDVLRALHEATSHHRNA